MLSAAVFFVLVAMFAVGLLLFLLGRRGRRLNDHPVCRFCSFDLHGIYPGAITCPECGAGLKRERSIRIGVRRRIVPFMIFGVVIALLPLAPMGVALYAAVTGENIHKRLPLAVLLFETRFASPASSKQIAEEILDRIVTQKLDTEAQGRAAERALTLQDDPAFPWTDAWGDIVEKARANNAITPEQIAAFRAAATTSTIKVRRRVRAGDPLPIRIITKGGRLGSETTLMIQASTDDWRIRGKSVRTPRPTSFPGRTINPWSIVNPFLGNGSNPSPFDSNGGTFMMYVGGSKSMWAQMGEMPWEFSLRVPAEAAPGPADLEVEFAFEFSDGANPIMPMSMRTPGSNDPKPTKFILKAAFEILPSGADNMSLIAPDEKTTAAIRTALAQSNAFLNQSSDGMTILPAGIMMPRTAWILSIQADDLSLPSPLSHDVFIRANGKELHAGTIVQGVNDPGAGALNPASRWNQPSTHFSVEVEGKNLPATVDLVLRPNPDLARRSVDVSSMYNAEIIVTGIKVGQNGLFSVPYRVVDDAVTPEDQRSDDKDKP